MTIYKSKVKTKDGRQYFFRIKYKNILGEVCDYTSKKYLKRKEAEDEEAKFRINLYNSTLSSSNIRIEDAYLEYHNILKNQLKPQSLNKIELYYNKYLKCICNKKINSLNINDYKYLKNELEKFNYTADYKNKILGLFARIIKYSSKCYNTSDQILKFIEKFKDTNIIKKEMLFFTYEEYTKFIENVSDYNYKVFFEVLYFMGLRKGECQALKWNDIDFISNTLKINKTLTTKLKGISWHISSPKTKNSTRILPIPKNVLFDLKVMHNNALRYKDYSNDWFIFGNSVPFRENTIELKKNKACDMAKVKRIRIHDFRHSCASLLINKGASIALVSKYLGHSNITVTLNTYTHMYKSELENISNIISNL